MESSRTSPSQPGLSMSPAAQLDQFISFMKDRLALSCSDSFHMITRLTDAIFSQTIRAGHVSTDGNFQLLIAIWAH